MADLRRALDARIERGELELPVLPRAARDVLRLAEDEDVDIRRIAEIVKSDPTLAGHVLRVVNTPLFRARTPIVSLHQALARLGAVRTRQVMLVIACETRALKAKGRDADAQRWLSHALDTAFYAQEIARVRRQSVEEGFLCGLLHDIGVPVLWQLVADMTEAGVVHASPGEIDRAVADLHPRVGADVARSWELPPRITGTIADHHAPLEAKVGRPSFGRAALALADVLAEAGEEGLDGEPAQRAIVALDLYPEDVAAVLASRRGLAEAA